MNKKKILIFGSTSFFLKYFINKYKKKIDFYYVDRYIKNKKHFKFTADKKKLYKIISKVNPDVIIYSSSVKDSKHNNNLNDLYNINLSVPIKIFNIIKDQPLIKFIHINSYYAFYPDKDLLVYSMSKFICYKILQNLSKLYNIKCLSLVLYDIFGKNDKRNKLFYNLFQNNNKYIYPVSNSELSEKIYKILNLNFTKKFNLLHLIPKNKYKLQQLYELSKKDNISIKKIQKISIKVKRKKNYIFLNKNLNNIINEIN